MNKKILQKLGFIIYHILTLKSEDLDRVTYNKICDKIYETLLDIAPEYKPRQIDTDFLDIITKTNRRLNEWKQY